MDFTSIFNISASGMSVEKARLDIAAINLANVNTTRSTNGQLFKPLRVISEPRTATDFETSLQDNLSDIAIDGAQVNSVEELNLAPRMVLDPGHPDADSRGYVAYPAVNSATEMIQIMTASRAYEADVRAMNAGKAMLQKALEIGGK